MKGLDARLNRIEDALSAQSRREQMKDRPLLIEICEGDRIPDYPGRGTGKGPLIIVRTRKDPPMGFEIESG